MQTPQLFKTLLAAFPMTLGVTGMASAGEWPPGGIGGICCPWSDAQLKAHVHPIENATEQLLKIQGVTFEWKDGGRKDIGVIAQDVQKVYPQLVREDKKYLQVDYEKLVAPLIESVRELNTRIKALEAEKAIK